MMMESGIDAFHHTVSELYGSNSSDVNTDKLRFFLPPLTNVDPKTMIQSIGVSTIISDNGPEYKYTVTWKEPTNKMEKKWTEKYATYSSDKSIATDKSTTSLLRKKSSIRIRANGTVICDGPCKMHVKLQEVAEFGCDHLICDTCRRTRKSVLLFDGTPGCCNEECVELAKHSGELIRAMSTTSISVLSQNGPWEVFNVHVSLVKKLNKSVVRSHLEYEFSSKDRVSSLIKTLYSHKELILESTAYYAIYPPKCRDDLTPISLIDTNQRFYDLVDFDNYYTAELYFIILGKGVQI